MIKTYKNYVINANIKENYNSLNENQISFEISKDGKTIDSGRVITNATLNEFVENNVETAIDKLVIKEKEENNTNWLTDFFTEYNNLQEAKDEKPDFLDLDKDGDKEEPMKQAAKDAEDDEETMDEATTTSSVHPFGTSTTVSFTKSPWANLDMGTDKHKKKKKKKKNESIDESSQTFYDNMVNKQKKENAKTNSKHVSQSLDNAKGFSTFPEGEANSDVVKKYEDNDKRKDGVFRNRGENMADVALAAAYDPMTGEFDEKYLERVEKEAKGPDGEGYDLMPHAEDRLKGFDPDKQDFWTGVKQNVDSVKGGVDFKYKEIKRESIDFNVSGNETIYTKKPINCSEDIDSVIGNRFKIDGNTYKISDGINETYFKWIGDVDGHSVIVNHLNEDGLKGELNRMDDLTNFKSKATSVNENVNMFREMMDNVRNGDMRFSLRDGIEERIMTVNECLGRFGESDVSKLKKLSRHESCTVYENNKPFLVRRIY